MNRQAVSKEEVDYSVVWLGLNQMDAEDVYKFESANSRINATHGFYAKYPGVEMFRRDGKLYLKGLRDMCQDVILIARRSLRRQIIFLILSPDMTETPWFRIFCRLIAKNVRPNGHLLVPVICGDYSDPCVCSSTFYKPNGLLWPAEECARRFGALFSYSKGNTPGLERLAELINRIMGGDLPGDEFPMYSFDECMLIAWNLNREDFNFWNPRRDAIPKYSIGEDGRPVFAIPISSLKGLPAPEGVFMG